MDPAARWPGVLLVASLALCASACQRVDPQVAIDARNAADEAVAERDAAAFRASVADGKWELASAQGDVLLADHGNSAAVAAITAQIEDARARAATARDTRRLAGLWTYAEQAVKGGSQRSAAIFAQEAIDTDGSGAKRVQLVFRDHPSWGRSSYLVLLAGDFACHGGCKVQVQVDDAAAKSMAALRPETDEAIAMFINDERALWATTRNAKTITVTFPVAAGGTRKAAFEVGGLDRARMPGWN